MNKIILDLCGGTGAWSNPYKKAGYDVRIIDYPIDVREYKPPNNTYGILAAPPCTVFSRARTKAKKPRDLKEGMEIVIACLKIIWECQYELETPTKRKTKLKFWALENPNGMLNYFLGRPVFNFNPWNFGDNYQKDTNLWGWFNVPKIKYTNKKNIMSIEQIKKAKTNSQNTNDFNDLFSKFDKTLMKNFNDELPDDYKIPPGYDKKKCIRAMTSKGFANAFYKANK